VTVFGRQLLAEPPTGAMQFWRRVLRGFSQCAFQANEVSGLLFVAAAAAYSWRMAVFFVISVVIATVVAQLLNGDRDLLDLGLFGFNSGLMGLALGNFYQPNVALWIMVVVLAAVVAAATVAMARHVPIPFLAAPFIGIFWLTWLAADTITNVIKLDLGPWEAADVHWAAATITVLGAALFSPALATGVLFLLGVLVSNWRHAVVALMGAVVAVTLAVHVGSAGSAINSGFVGFNAVLAALAVYVVIGPDLRLALLGAVLATWVFSYVNRTAPVPALASGFVLAVWIIMFLGWLNHRFAAAT
jgi:urea transporter